VRIEEGPTAWNQNDQRTGL